MVRFWIGVNNTAHTIAHTGEGLREVQSDPVQCARAYEARKLGQKRGFVLRYDHLSYSRSERVRLIETWRSERAYLRYSSLSDRLLGKHDAATPTGAREGLPPDSELQPPGVLSRRHGDMRYFPQLSWPEWTTEASVSSGQIADEAVSPNAKHVEHPPVSAARAPTSY